MAEKHYPDNWGNLLIDYDPNDHLLQLERFDKRQNKKIVNDYLNVQNRLIWFLKDQRALILAGVATTSYVIQTEMVEHDQQAQWANFKTYVRDVLGNEATMYGSEGVKDFFDYLEKASTKSLGRALLLLGYGTAFADELDEGERVVDSPVEHKEDKKPTPIRPQQQQNTAPAPTKPKPAPAAPQGASGAMSATEFIKLFRQEYAVEDAALALFCKREGIQKTDLPALARFLKEAEHAAHVRCINWAQKKNFVPTLLETYKTRESIDSYVALLENLKNNAKDVAIALELIRDQG